MATPEDIYPAAGLKVRLHPFLHQVGGSNLMFKFDNDTVCKHLLPREYDFYKVLPESLKEFTAHYKGSIEIQFEEEPDGTIAFFGIVPPSKASTLNLEIETDTCRVSDNQQNCVDYIKRDDLILKRSGSIEIDGDSLDSYDNPTLKLETSTRQNKRLTALLTSSTSGAERRFILLENLVSNFRQPSILDLKMGTRTHGDEDAEQKRLRKTRKCERSTSQNMGVRLHGMQKYNVNNGKFETLGKAVGLKMSSDEFKSAVTSFLHDGTRLRTELVQPICKRLQQYYHCVSQQNTFRFYSSSLLIIYDGAPMSTQTANVDVRAIDFAHTTHQSSPYLQNGIHTGPDKGYLLGIQTLTDIFQEMMPK